ncbi:MAG: hypothetical protein JOZ69_07870 [Myxococcales bacterium]|nr:hypothetical protein [Myxococcales bacterium]
MTDAPRTDAAAIGGMGMEDCASHARLPMEILGSTWLVLGVWTLIASREPLAHLNWVRFAVSFPFVLLFALLASALKGDVPLRLVAPDLGFNVLFVVLFIVFFPRRRERP